MKKISKKGAAYGVIALLLCAAVYLNRSYVEAPQELLAAEQAVSTGEEENGTGEQNYFATSRLSREKARDEAVSALRAVSESETAEPSAKQEADAKISVLAAQTVSEANAESMIRAKGYSDAVVMIGDGSVNVVVAPPEGGLKATDVTVIKDIVVAETGASVGQIKITEAM